MSAHETAGSKSPPTRWQKFRMVVKVVEMRLRFVALMTVTGLIFAYWDSIWNHYEKWTRPPGENLAATASDVEYYCPMHPTVIQGDPGSCPICGMPLSKRKKGEVEALPEGVLSRVLLSSDRVAQAGIKTVGVDYAPLAETVVAVGTVEVDERRLRRISSKVKGLSRVEKLFVNFTGTEVKAGEPLAELYSPELYQAVQELLLAQRTARERPRPQTALGRSVLGDDNLVGLARERLRLWGIAPEQIDEFLRAGKADFRLPILSPIGGVVIRRNVVEGKYVAEGESMFDVADLSHVWVKARVYENQMALVRVGQTVEATVQAFPGETFAGKVAFIDPVLDPETRTVGVRYDLENADLRLRPGMFATVSLQAPIAEVPAFKAKLAATDAGGGTPTVEAQKICPVTTLKLGAMGDPVPVEVVGRKVWICCDGCESKLAKEPTKYLAKLAPAPKGEVLSIPESAVVDTGARKIVYVEAEPGVFEGREVILGPISNGRYPVLDGLSAGETVADQGSFLIDAENRLNPAAGGKPAHAEHQHEHPAHDEHPAHETPAPRSAAADPVQRR